MARKRMLSPTIWDDPSFNKMSAKGRLAFIGLISHADDDGYLRGDLGSIRRLVFGFETSTDEDWYKELREYKNLHFFENNTETYCHLVNWDKYQSQREDRRQETTYPKCPLCGQMSGKWQTSVRQVPAEVSKEVSKLSKKGNGYQNFKKAKDSLKRKYSV